jgi:hypothetical protein
MGHGSPMRRLFQPRWSARVHEEWMTAVLHDRPDLTAAQLQRTCRLMDENIDDALVGGSTAAPISSSL